MSRGDYQMYLLGFLISLILLSWLGGWIHAHQTVAMECKKLKVFYVGGQVFHCHALEESGHDNQ